jgi:hypothetical protein
MPDALLFWKPRADLQLSPAEVAREILWGEEVEGLVDLPVKEVIDRLKAEFPDHRETPGLLILHTGDGQIDVTWTWQHIKLTTAGVAGADCERAAAVVASFGCVEFAG